MATKTTKPTKAVTAKKEVKKVIKEVVETPQVEAAAVPEETPQNEMAELTAPAKKGKKSTATFDLHAAQKGTIIESFAQKSGDTGSPEVQVALLSHKIVKLIEHLNLNKKDNHSRRGLLKVVAKRRRILSYLQGLNEERYSGLIAKLGLKK